MREREFEVNYFSHVVDVHLNGTYRMCSKSVDILSKNDKLLGCGIIAYDSDEIEIISGKKSTEIKKVLGYKGRDEAIHRNDMVIK